MKHDAKKIAEAATLFFRVRGLVRQRLAEGKRLDPSAWLHIETLIFIRDHKESSMHEVASYLSITAPSATSLIRTLTRAGLVSCSTDKQDQRTHRLALTRKGKARLASAMRHGHTVFHALFSSLTDTELAAFTRALKAVLSLPYGPRD